MFFGLRVEGSRGLIEKDDAGILKDSPGNSHSLLLSTAQPQAPFSNLGLIAIREGEDLVMNTGCATCLVDFLVTGGWIRIFEVVHQSLVEQDGILRYNTDVAAKGFDSDAVDPAPVKIGRAHV